MDAPALKLVIGRVMLMEEDALLFGLFLGVERSDTKAVDRLI